MTGVLLLFLDGVGIGPDDSDHNPFLSAELPLLRSLLGGRIPTLSEPAIVHGAWRDESDSGPASRRRTGPDRPAASVPLDALLGVDGTPQSGTGQTALLTGFNAPAEFGKHFGPWVPVSLRPLVEERSLLRRAVDAGIPTVFANAYPRGWPGPRGSRRVAGPPLAARGAGLLVRDHEELASGAAVSSEMVNEAWREHLGHGDLPRIDERQAGANLGRIAAGARLTLYAHYATDAAGHRGGMEGSRRALERVDAFLTGVLSTLPRDHSLFVVSDHGNIEDTRGGHTRNPALGLLVGPEAEERSGGVNTLMDVTPAVLGWMGVRH